MGFSATRRIVCAIRRGPVQIELTWNPIGVTANDVADVISR
jgi:hypothetical protein